MNRRRPPRTGSLYAWRALEIWCMPKLLGILGRGGGGDKGKLSERSTQSKPPGNLRLSGAARFGTRLETGKQMLHNKMEEARGWNHGVQGATSTSRYGGFKE
jgi:hypothetical protein